MHVAAKHLNAAPHIRRRAARRHLARSAGIPSDEGRRGTGAARRPRVYGEGACGYLGCEEGRSKLTLVIAVVVVLALGGIVWFLWEAR